jgi:adsorption protein B
VTGIALQGWERHGWNVNWRQAYWFWRDRKGVVGNLLTPLDNLLVLYSLARYPQVSGMLPEWLSVSCQITLAISILQMGMRSQSAAQIYGWRFASLVPARIVWANMVNFSATARALAEYGIARWAGVDLQWKKTEHTYPVNPQWAPEPDPVPDR